METELWGTFSVTDHLRRRPYVADVILYDHLVVPKPPDEDEEEKARWKYNNWNPGHQADLLKVLGDLAVPIPWTKQNRENWEAMYISASADQRSKARLKAASAVCYDANAIIQAPADVDPMHVTRMLLQHYGNNVIDSKEFKRLKAMFAAPGARVEAVAAYGSYAQFNDDIPVLTEPDPSDSERRVLLFGWNFFVPDDPDLTDYQLLERAVKLAEKRDFKENRALFHKWQRQIIAGEVDAGVAQKDLEKRLTEYGQMVRRSGLRTKALYAVSVAAATAPLLDFVAPGVGVATGAFFALGALAAERFLPNQEPTQYARVSAIFYDARKQFGWN